MPLYANDGKSWRLSQLTATKTINKLVYSPYFLFLLAFFAVIGNVLEFELGIYGVYTAFVVYISVFGRDFLPIIPLAINCYILPSAVNNPGKHAGSIFYPENGGYAIYVMAALIFIAFLFRLIFDREIGFRNLTKVNFKLMWGMVALAVCYALSGIGSKGYAETLVQNLAFALLQVASVCGLYFLLRFSVKWEACDKRYFAYALVLMGLVIGAEVLNVYASGTVIVDGNIHKSNIYLGWGISNNIGMQIAMAIPGAFYFVHKGEKVILYNALAVLLCLFMVLTTSRAAILGGGLIYGACAAFVFFKSKCKTARVVTFVSAFAFLIVTLGVLLSSDIIEYTFAHGLQSQSRISMYLFGLELFEDAPFFGNGFFSLNAHSTEYYIWEKVGDFSEGFPDRWHNTVIQLLVSCGAMGFLAYLYHRYQTLKLFLVKINEEKIFIGFSLILLLALSLVDCHFFNVGPVLLYSCALAFVEGLESVEEKNSISQETL